MFESSRQEFPCSALPQQGKRRRKKKTTISCFAPAEEEQSRGIFGGNFQTPVHDGNKAAGLEVTTWLQIVKNLGEEVHEVETQLHEAYNKEKARMAPELLDDIYYRVFGLTDDQEDDEVVVIVTDEDDDDEVVIIDEDE